jgi:hypothetical protein
MEMISGLYFGFAMALALRFCSFYSPQALDVMVILVSSHIADGFFIFALGCKGLIPYHETVDCFHLFADS